MSVFLQKLFLWNFRNHTERQYHFEKRFICFFGKNGVGKSNLLDAIYYSCCTKSALYFSDSENIQHKKKHFTLYVVFLKNNSINTVGVNFSLFKKKNNTLNSKNIRKSEYIGRFPAVFFSPFDIDLIKAGSEIRRRYIDSVFCQIDKEYLHTLIQYKRVIKQRNQLLKQIFEKKQSNVLLGSYDEEMVKYGEKIFEKRKKYLIDWQTSCQKEYEKITKKTETVQISYQSSLEKAPFAELLKKNRNIDLENQSSSVGTHKDDIVFFLNQYPLKKFASQGEQKSFLIALKLSSCKIIEENLKISPILLLDDFFDKLDRQRSTNLLKYIYEEHTCQVFISDTQGDRMKNYSQKIELLQEMQLIEV